MSDDSERNTCSKRLGQLLGDWELQGKLVLVEWLDSHHRAGWTTEQPEVEPLTCISVGWLIGTGRNAKTLASHMTGEQTPQRAGEMTIPTKAIVRMEVLQ